MLVHIMIDMSMTVPSMHQQMQQGAQEEQQVREHAEDMRPVFREEKKHSNGKECEQNQPARSPYPAILPGWIISGHRFLLHGDFTWQTWAYQSWLGSPS
jgi:hypothetical protein